MALAAMPMITKTIMTSNRVKPLACVGQILG
jgi:hypothetical protein